MSSDPISVTTNTSWFSRLGSAFGGVLTGLALIVACVGLLAWNEGRSVKSIRANNEGAGAVVPVSTDRIQPANDGRLVHFTGPATTEGQRTDTALGVTADGLSLSRKVEYFQWVENRQTETRTKMGGGEETVTTYSYERKWTASPEDSSAFHQPAGHQNPAPTLSNESFQAETARVGAFTLDASVVSQVPTGTSLAVTAEQAAAASQALARTVRVQDGALYVGSNPALPQPGDMRVTYAVAPQATTLSIVGAQTASGVQPYPTKAGAPILMVRTGAASAEQMFSAAKASNQTLSWILRGVGAIIMIAAFGMVLGPLGVLADVIPLFGSIVRMGTGLVAGALGLSLSLVVIAAAWVVYRPIVGIGLLVIAAAVAGFLIWRSREATTAA